MTAALSDQFGVDLQSVAEQLRRITVVVRGATARERGRGDAQGSGILWSSDGTIVTNAHVATTERSSIVLADGRSATARIVARDQRRDVALLRIDGESIGNTMLPTPTLGAPAMLRPGELVVALGHPLGVEHALAMGVVHAAPVDSRSPYVVADIRLAPGNSGGPLADARGRVVGVNSMIVGGLGVAISTDVVSRFVEAATPRPKLGVELREVTVRATSGDRAMSPALLVLRADPNGAAARAGIGQGDVLLGHAGRPFRSPDELSALVKAAGAGGILRIDIGRGGRRTTAEVLLPAVERTRRNAA
jgi:serine protease Do